MYTTRFNTKDSPFCPNSVWSSQPTPIISTYDTFQSIFLMEAHLFPVSYRLNFDVQCRLILVFKGFWSVIICLVVQLIYSIGLRWQKLRNEFRSNKWWFCFLKMCTDNTETGPHYLLIQGKYLQVTAIFWIISFHKMS